MIVIYILDVIYHLSCQPEFAKTAMPRMSEEEKQRSHGRIVDAAARLFRERGIESTSVADVMKAAGMTHGGFYRHFASKEDLVAAALRHAVDGVVSKIENAGSQSEKAAERAGYIEDYLSSTHVHEWGKGCPLASLGVEVARQKGSQHEEGAAAVRRMAALLPSDPANKTQGFAMMALMMGALQLARLAPTQEEAGLALKAGRMAVELLQAHWSDDDYPGPG